MIYKETKKQIIEDFNNEIKNGKVDLSSENLKVSTTIFFNCLEENLDKKILNKGLDPVSYINLMSEVMMEIPELLTLKIGHIFQDLIDDDEDRLSYIFSTALISYTLNDITFELFENKVFTDEFVIALGFSREDVAQMKSEITNTFAHDDLKNKPTIH